jgi:hypothetical protein
MIGVVTMVTIITVDIRIMTDTTIKNLGKPKSVAVTNTVNGGELC